ncbi:MAG: N-acetylglucosamine-6-phosphate deacetylase [Flavobacteriales bacterium]|nr:MAG: N-acetylglucosamine-6-phosphate deacetylase [Flavobacteriales bacterium]
MLAITNVTFFENSKPIEGRNVFVDKGKIIEIAGGEIPTNCEILDGKNGYLVSSFIDLQIYGSGGNLFSAFPTAETLAQMEGDLFAKGTTGFLACVATNSSEVMKDSIKVAKAHRPVAKGFLGLHLEGPYLNAKRKGAHIASYIKKATLDEVKELIDLAEGEIKMMTIAPELQDDEVIRFLLDNKVVLSMGHSDATFEQATEAYDKGIQTTTHLFNAMPSIHHREPNLPTAFFNHETAMASIIADGNHVNFEIIKMSHKLAGDRMFLITDTVTSCNVGPYQHRLVGDKFVTADGTLSGANISLLQAVQNCVKHCGISIADALAMASLHPARLIKQDDVKGKVAIDYQSNLLLLDKSLNLMQVLA